ncbi:Dol-P-Man:Man(7)GlcNAc(2)-PP-Dol alpha-1,6-mannosyltransferase [Exophiala xenobiotica]|uniref:Mannosyltransferase n=1 Tax=Vermiconidia calcicola TaxID=1690605 RepID=A0AAV9QNU8_9PEZI|nr:Dol-P-Man:Man(7)GlcNAc(2)-PP-Dol alpha-1,6-mannosyltransferase [Exophiala xenobiotica]KAK5545810.1 Dol-P-Man:Man(7)GlcNAc(2)-PP-Dol alpha-1,6-mannosyltransferase [Vermiconidia calcicola]KAK5549929.1 Dol-P-Man:Man(7)GlcNAc(2)-PP-Dol alpha-1,6-mannosyltransferase [Chaetothyriales sp. CCFEE 6169]KAK5271596.1 Dol-P-Man:Man(7)GlcNAc(2)-PP-Dol alpha-1,6-mannosyltransferase [Exophiala xenobiotica]KAK5295776.1 Dol-P-Man:Man(7)GlcNAc(2)-PP-Dol alpha-1,6-mannosyltransferase [Exophiala xenobiotica]
MARVELWYLGSLSIVALILLHLNVSRYTKVEESFNIQATHDILKYGVPTHNVYLKLKAQYDHMTFAGAVPRTFIGSLVLAAFAKPFVWYGHLDGEQQQMLVRGFLGLFNGLALVGYASGLLRAYGIVTAIWYTMLQASQFHILYYASRTLPNMFAFGTTTIALRFLLPDPGSAQLQARRTRLALYLLTLATIIFRSEIALLLASHCAYLLLKAGTFNNAISLVRAVFLPAILSATVAGLLLTVSIDTFFWQSRRLLWPELAAFLSNVLPSKDDGIGASAWGTSPWHWYFTSALPRLLLNPLLLLLPVWGGLTTTLRSSILDLTIPSMTYTALYSILPHKETRFLFPVVPPITAAIALCAGYITTRRNRYISYKLTHYLLVLSTMMSALLSTGLLLPLSALTYPGGHALTSLHALSLNYGPRPRISVHLTNLALQTGVTHFLDEPSSRMHARPVFHLPGSADGRRPSLTSTRPTQWVYDKTDNETEFLTPSFWNQFDYVVVEDPARVIGAWDVVDKVPGLGKPSVLQPDVGRGLLVLGPKNQRREDDALSRLVEELYGSVGKSVYGIVHDVVREGYGVDKVLGHGWSWTKGWWVHWGLETKLYILKRSESGISP